MPNAIDELSRMIGQIQADVAHTRKSSDEINGKVDALTKTVAHQEFRLQESEKKIQKIQPEIEDYKKLKQRSIGAMAVLATIFGAVGSVVSKLLGGLF